MSLFITSLNSGSNGNCYYVGNSHEAVLIDAGISCREIEKRMKRLGLKMEMVKAVFISHEHSDHISGIRTLVKKHKLPVYISSQTLRGCRFTLDQRLVRNFMTNEVINIGRLTITAFAKHHDACDPCSFTVSCNNTTVGVFTDIGTPCSSLIKYFKRCHAAFLEANYDEQMLDNGGYPYHLKRRIRGGQGHLSNTQALEVFTKYRPTHLSHLILAHLSKNNNSPQLVEQLFNRYANGVNITIASRYEETPVLYIEATQPQGRRISVRSATPQLAFEFA